MHAVVCLSVSSPQEAGTAAIPACLTRGRPVLGVCKAHCGTRGGTHGVFNIDRLSSGSFLERREEDRCVPGPGSWGWWAVISSVSSKHGCMGQNGTGRRAGCVEPRETAPYPGTCQGWRRAAFQHVRVLGLRIRDKALGLERRAWRWRGDG